MRIYHYGDTCIFDMRLIGELYRPTVGLLGCTAAEGALAPDRRGRATFLTGEMDADEAARAAEMLGLELAVACHYLDAGRGGRALPRARGRARQRRAGARASRPWSGRPLVVKDGRPLGSRRTGGRMRLVTYSAGGRTGVGLRRDGAVFDTGYADMLDADRRRPGRARARPAPPDEGGRDAQLLGADPPRQDPLLRGQLREPRRGEPERGDARGAVLLLEAPERRHRPRRADPDPASDDADRLRGRARNGDRDAWLPDLGAADALEHVFGWTILHDVSARDVQFKDSQITLGKNPDTFAPIGPEIVTRDELGDWSTLRVSSTLNGAGDAGLGDRRDAVPPGSAARVPYAT